MEERKFCSIEVVPNLGFPDILGLKLPEGFTASCAGQDLWELQFKNIWELNWEPLLYRMSC